MTAEIAILNSESVALAADSAVTFNTGTEQKIFTSANKIFSLSKYRPIGIMVYGNAQFMGMPWETVIKNYRKELSDKNYDLLDEYKDSFIKYIKRSKYLFPEPQQKEYVKGTAVSCFRYIKNRIEEKLDEVLEKKIKVSRQEIASIASDIISEHHRVWKKTKRIKGVPGNYKTIFLRKYRKDINIFKERIFEKIPINKRALFELDNIVADIFIKYPEEVTRGSSGIVIAGFGEKENFPSLAHIDIEGVANNVLKYKVIATHQVTYKNSAIVVPFAQQEMVCTFMEGIDPEYDSLIKKYLINLCKEYPSAIIESIKILTNTQKNRLKLKFQKVGKQTLEKYMGKLNEYRKINYVNPIIEVVNVLPKNDLASMAESLVKLTSLKRKVALQAETVSEPIDVAVISKGDGLIWVKRKHYFKTEYNPHFLANYYKEGE